MGDRFTIVSTTPGSVATATGISLVTAASAAAARTAIGVTASSHTSGTLAARPATPAAGDTYEITSGAASGDRYACYVAGTWVITGYSRVRLDETPYHWWRLDDASGGAVDSGSAGTALAEAGSGAGTLVYRAPTLTGRGVRFRGSPGALRFQSAKDAGMAITTAATYSAWVRSDVTTGQHAVIALESDQGSWAAPYGALTLTVNNGGMRALCATTDNPSTPQVAVYAGVSPGVDVLVGLTVESSTLTLWVDGVAQATLALSGPTIVTTGPNVRWVIGDQPGINERMDGRVADARVYTTAKDAAWWAEAYARGVGSYEGQ